MPKRSKYSQKKINEVALMFLIHGHRQKVSDLTGIPLTTLADWITGKKNVEQWDVALKLATKEADSDRQAMWQSILMKTSEKMAERIELGDPIVKDGKVTGYKPVTLKDVSWTHGVITDKLRVSEGKATSISGKPSSELNKLAKLFDDITSGNNKISNEQTNNENVNQSDVHTNLSDKASRKKELH